MTIIENNMEEFLKQWKSFNEYLDKLEDSELNETYYRDREHYRNFNDFMFFVEHGYLV